MTELTLAIDASRNRSGGAQAHLIGILGRGDPAPYGIRKVHLWSYRKLLDALPNAPWLVKHNPTELEGSLGRQVWWQRRSLPKEVLAQNCDILLNTDAGTVCPFRPAVTMSRDMLSYEPGEMRRYWFSKAWIRLFLLRYIQARSMRNSDGVIFLTSYARETIQRIVGPFEHGTVIPHGVGESFRRPAAKKGPPPDEREVHCLYVSNTAMYKHQWVVVRAIGELRKRGRKISLTLAGGGTGNAQRILEEEIARTDPEGRFVTLMGAVAHQELPSLLERADLFVFASSCENMPNTLLEAMASGLPIACSNRGPMPEVLQDGGTYFDPEDPASIAEAVEKLLKDTGTMEALAGRAKALSDQYSWERCSRETWAFLAATVARLRKSGAV